MIETPQPSVPSARRGRPRLAAAVGVVVALLGIGTLPTASLAAPTAATVSRAAAVSTPTPEPSPTASSGEAVLTLAPIAGGVLRPGERLTVSVTMTNDTAAPTPAGTVSLGFSTTPLTDRAALERWLAGDAQGVTTAEVATGEFPAVVAGGTQTQGLMSADGDPVFAALTPGVYPIAATLTTPTGSSVSTSAIVVPDDGAPDVGIGVVVPITGPATAEGLLTAEQLEELTAPDGALTAQLDAVEGTDAILAVDPAVAAAIRVLGTAAPDSAGEWLDRLLALPNPRFALQFGDADVAAQVQAAIVPPLRPRSLQTYMSPTDFLPVPAEETPAATAQPSPTPSA